MPKRALVVVAGALICGAVAASSATAGSRKVEAAFRSFALGSTLRYEVYLPPGYDAGTRRYPVVYFLHGLPAGATAFRSLGFVERALDAVGGEAILVLPQGARAGEADPEYADRGPRDRWSTAIGEELPRVVDARFRTIPARGARALVGVSAGGYGAMHLALEYVDDYAVVESWSGYFHPTDPTGTQAVDLGPGQDVHRQLQAVRRKLAQRPLFIAFYVGRGDARFAAENKQLNRELSAVGIPHVFRLYPGGHEQALWQRYAPSWLSLALAHLAAPQ